MMFKDRRDAGRKLTQALERFKTVNQDWCAGYLRTDLLPPHEIRLADEANHASGVVNDGKRADLNIDQWFRNFGYRSLRLSGDHFPNHDVRGFHDLLPFSLTIENLYKPKSLPNRPPHDFALIVGRTRPIKLIRSLCATTMTPCRRFRRCVSAPGRQSCVRAPRCRRRSVFRGNLEFPLRRRHDLGCRRPIWTGWPNHAGTRSPRNASFR